ncbi:ATP-dependent RNA helicase Hca4p [Diutina catenulata]
MAKKERKAQRKKEKDEFESIAKRLANWDDAVEVEKFDDLPLSEATKLGLKGASFVQMTEVQRKTIVPALKGEDIMATAKTGSGKTLAFLIPVIEALNRANITEYDGLAALIISPTRELAIQIFEVLTKIGKHNQFSAGLVTGGKDVKFEKERVGRMNILVGTPGRVAQHLNEAVGMETANLQVLVLDEADRCLDMGFKKQIDSIVRHLPLERQTLLFSATSSDSVDDLARLSLVNPFKIGVSADASATPESLDQYYVEVPLEQKLDVLWSFIKSHLKSKIIVFFSSSKQVQFAYESFRHLQPGISLLKLYGRHKQTSRMETTVKFSHAQYACLFATDIVARGLDFPAIDWVVQLDCPEDAATYVHRAGRAARFGKSGKSMLMLTPAETPFLNRLAEKHIEPKLMTIKGKAKKTIRPQLQSLCFKDPTLKNLAQRAFIAYFRSVHVQKDKEVFSVEALPVEGFAASLGLAGAPKIKMGSTGKDKKNINRKLMVLETQANDEGEVEKSKKERTRYDRMFERQNQTVLSNNYRNMTGNDDEDSDEDFITVKRKDHHLEDGELPDLSAPVSKRQAKKQLSRKASLAAKGNPTKLKFDDEGVAHPLYELQDEEDFAAAGDAAEQKQQFVAKEAEVMAMADAGDKALAKEKKKEKKRKRKEAERAWEAQLEADMEPSDDEQPRKKAAKWWKDDDETSSRPEVVEIDQPETVEDLEALAERLMG